MKMNATLGIEDSLYFCSVMIMCAPVTLSAHHKLLSLNLPWEILRGTLSSSCSIAKEYCVHLHSHFKFSEIGPVAFAVKLGGIIRLVPLPICNVQIYSGSPFCHPSFHGYFVRGSFLESS